MTENIGLVCGVLFLPVLQLCLSLVVLTGTTRKKNIVDIANNGLEQRLETFCAKYETKVIWVKDKR